MPTNKILTFLNFFRILIKEFSINSKSGLWDMLPLKYPITISLLFFLFSLSIKAFWLNCHISSLATFLFIKTFVIYLFNSLANASVVVIAPSQSFNVLPIKLTPSSYNFFSLGDIAFI